MATITTLKKGGSEQRVLIATSDPQTTVADAVSIALDGFSALSKVSIGVVMKDAGGNVVAATSGNFDVLVRTINTQQDEPVPGGTTAIPAAAPITLSMEGNLIHVTVTPNTLVAGTVTSWQLVVSGIRG